MECPELSRERVGEVAGLGEVTAWLEQQDERKPGRLAGALEPPSLVGPDVGVVAGSARGTVDAVLAGALWFGGGRREQVPRLQTAFERKGLPFVDRRAAQPGAYPGEELLRGLGHDQRGYLAGVQWPEQFYERKRGIGCPFCSQGRPEVMEPVKLNYSILGNSVPHLHTHVVPRYREDPRPLWPFPFPDPEPGPVPEDELARDLTALRVAAGQRT